MLHEVRQARDFSLGNQTRITSRIVLDKEFLNVSSLCVFDRNETVVYAF